MSAEAIIFGIFGLFAACGFLFFAMGTCIELYDVKRGRTLREKAFIGGATAGMLGLGTLATFLLALAWSFR